MLIASESAHTPGSSAARVRRAETGSRPVIGLIVNPMAGMGGRVGLKGSDGAAEEARLLGATEQSHLRGARALAALLTSVTGDFSLVTCAAAMGHTSALLAGIEADAILSVSPHTSASDTTLAAQRMVANGVELLIFVGGDGTAGDIYAAVGDAVPVLGVPAGVKMHSGVFATTPEAAGTIAASFVDGRIGTSVARDVMDIDEYLLKEGVLVPRLIGELRVPDGKTLVQHPKSRAARGTGDLAGLGAALLQRLEPEVSYAVGPGRTAGAVLGELGLQHTLLGFDLIAGDRMVVADANERDLLAAVGQLGAVLAPIGGQGFLLGRGNQQLSPRVLDRIDPQRLHIVATRERLAELQGRPLLIDIDDPALAAKFSGVRPVLTETGVTVYYPVAG